MPVARLPRWRLPLGVDRALWDYAQDTTIAADYDQYFAQNSLFEFDRAVVERCVSQPGIVVDLGCGTGRMLTPLARRGCHGIAVDLSLPMLRVVGEKAARENLNIDRIRANMVELDGLRDGVADYCVSMFSTLGMVRGADHRLQMLRHARRILKPGGRLVIHVHNRARSLFTREGRRWLLGNALRRWTDPSIGPGDMAFNYRGIPNVFVYSFSRGEFLGLLREAGFRLEELIPLDTERRHALRWPWLLGRWRANGWIAICRA